MTHQLSFIVTHEASTLHCLSWRLLSFVSFTEEAKRPQSLLRLQHVDSIKHFAGWPMQPTSQSSLDSFFVNDLKSSKNILDIFWFFHTVLWLMLELSNSSSWLKLLRQRCLLEFFILLLCLHFTSYLLVAEILPIIILLFHELRKVFRVQIWPQLLKYTL